MEHIIGRCTACYTPQLVKREGVIIVGVDVEAEVVVVGAGPGQVVEGLCEADVPCTSCSGGSVRVWHAEIEERCGKEMRDFWKFILTLPKEVQAHRRYLEAVYMYGRLVGYEFGHEDGRAVFRPEIEESMRELATAMENDPELKAQVNEDLAKEWEAS